VFDALLASYGGDLARVFSHVQVERYTSAALPHGRVGSGRRCRRAAERRSPPTARQRLAGRVSSVALYETQGELVTGRAVSSSTATCSSAARRLKDLLMAIEDGEVAS